jgi:uncharacterized protein YdaU (DUF1376 family)
MAELPFMPIKIPDLLSDVGDLPNALFGAYVRLLFKWWVDGALPEKNEKRLARWAGLSSADFDDLKEFLVHTESGWIQKRLMRTYAEQMTKSIKASNSANARHGKADAQDKVNERIAKAYADRLLRMKDEPIVEANASTQKKKIKNKKEKQPASDVSRGTIEPVLPSEPEAQEAAQRIIQALGGSKYVSWFVEGGESIISVAGGMVFIRTNSHAKPSMIDNRFGARLDDVFGKGGWKTELIQTKAA